MVSDPDDRGAAVVVVSGRVGAACGLDGGVAGDVDLRPRVGMFQNRRAAPAVCLLLHGKFVLLMLS